MAEVEALLEADIDLVWSIVSDHRGLPRWLLPGARVTLEPEGHPEPDGVGAVRVIRQLGFVGREQVLCFEAPYRLVYTVISGIPLLYHRGTLTLSAEGEAQTRLRWVVEFQPRLSLLGWPLERVIGSTLAAGVRRLPALLS